MINLSQANIKDAFQKVISERPTTWLEFFIDYYTQQGYGLENQYQGLEGTIEILKARKKLELDILAKLDINKEIIDNSAYDKQLIRTKLAELLAIKKTLVRENRLEMSNIKWDCLFDFRTR